MLTNFHTHTTFCDGKNTPEEIVLFAIDRGYSSIGFSGHGYTPFDLRYCMKDTEGYISAINSLKSKYKNKIQIYLGIEEDAFAPVKKEAFDYRIGSSHYFCVDEKYYPIDSNVDYFKKCIEVFDNDILKLSEAYYSTFLNYIRTYKPDIIGHFDVITKFDESDLDMFLKNEKYIKISEKYMIEFLKSDIIFEVNTGAIARGYRKNPYPNDNLLYLIKKNDGKLMLSSDSHSIETIDFYFEETKKKLKDIGFSYTYILYDGEFKKDYI